MEIEGEASNDDLAPDTARDMEALADYPIMMLFKRLIGNDNKQNTVLTNSQIKDILEKEFNIATEDLHELEMDIYLSIMKKFLKDWPQWDDFDSDNHELKQKNDHVEMDKMLLKKYHQLKSYLSNMLDVAIPKAKDKVLEVEERFSKMQQEEPKETPEEDLSDVILEIQCSRPQLNKLILRHPHPKQNYTIFNTIESGPSTITLDSLDYEAILNWCEVEIVFKLQSVHFTRSTVHGFKHTLMNKKLNVKNKSFKLKSGYQEKPTVPIRPSELNNLKKESFALILKNTFMRVQDFSYKHLLTAIYSVIEKDLAGLPNDLHEMMSYRKYFSKYPYIRDLCTDVPEAKTDKEAMSYDLHLRELISPMYQLDILKVEPLMKKYYTPGDLQNIYVKCKSCSMKFLGLHMLDQLREHILDHLHEPDWQCMKCKATFTMVNLAKNRWHHTCIKGVAALT